MNIIVEEGVKTFWKHGPPRGVEYRFKGWSRGMVQSNHLFDQYLKEAD